MPANTAADNYAHHETAKLTSRNTWLYMILLSRDGANAGKVIAAKLQMLHIEDVPFQSTRVG